MSKQSSKRSTVASMTVWSRPPSLLAPPPAEGSREKGSERHLPLPHCRARRCCQCAISHSWVSQWFRRHLPPNSCTSQPPPAPTSGAARNLGDRSAATPAGNWRRRARWSRIWQRCRWPHRWQCCQLQRSRPQASVQVALPSRLAPGRSARRVAPAVPRGASSQRSSPARQPSGQLPTATGWRQTQTPPQRAKNSEPPGMQPTTQRPPHAHLW